MSDSIRWWVPRSAADLGYERPVEGPEAVVQLAGGASDRFYRSGSIRREYHSFVAEGDLVSVWFTMTAVTRTGPVIKATTKLPVAWPATKPASTPKFLAPAFSSSGLDLRFGSRKAAAPVGS
jgi:hypothetical protein